MEEEVEVVVAGLIDGLISSICMSCSMGISDSSPPTGWGIGSLARACKGTEGFSIRY